MNTAVALEQKIRTADLVTANVRAEASRRGLTQVQLAGLAGLTQSQVSRRWKGLQLWTYDELDILADLFGMEVADFFQVAQNPARWIAPSRAVVRREGIEPPTRWLRVKLASTCDNVVDLNAWKQSQTLKAIGQ